MHKCGLEVQEGGDWEGMGEKVEWVVRWCVSPKGQAPKVVEARGPLVIAVVLFVGDTGGGGCRCRCCGVASGV